MKKLAATTCHAGAILQIDPEWDWPEFWAHVQALLMQRGYRNSSRRQYRNVLRAFRASCACRPAEVTRRHVREHLHELGRRRLSRSWIGMNVSVLRGVFDRACDRSLTATLRCPKPASRIPEILTPDEVRSVLAKAPTLRDQLLLGFLYGCGLKVGEAVRLCWGDIDTDQGTVQLKDVRGEPTRSVGLPKQLLPLLIEGVRRCPPQGYLFVGRREGTHLSIRMAEYIVQRAAEASGVGVPVTALTLRDCFAVHSLQAGMNIRELQESLGHLHIHATLRYQSFLVADGLESPLDKLGSATWPHAAPMGEHTRPEPFEEPLEAGPLLSQDTWITETQALYASLKTHLGGTRYLAHRAGSRKPG